MAWRPPSLSVLTWPFLGACAWGGGEGSGVSSYKDTILLDQGSALMNSFNLNYPLIGPIFKYSHIGVGTSTYEFWGDTIQSITET